MSSHTLHGNEIYGEDKPLGLILKKNTGKIIRLDEKWDKTGLAADMTIDKVIIDSKDYQGDKTISIGMGYVPFTTSLSRMVEDVKENPEKSITIITKSTGGGMKYKRNRRSRRIRRTKRNKSKKRKSKKANKIKSKRNKK